MAWEEDLKAAGEELGKFLDKYFYARLSSNNTVKYMINGNEVNIQNQLIDGFERMYSKAEQKAGIDVIVNIRGNEYLIDEKCSLDYINKDIPTFIMELSFLGKNKEIKEGWFLNCDIKTDVYLLIWPKAVTEKKSEINMNSFTQLDCIWIQKESIENYMIQNGYTKLNLTRKAETIRNTNKYGTSDKQKGKKFYFYFTENLDEKPINLVIYKDELIRLADSHYIVTKEKVTRLK